MNDPVDRKIIEDAMQRRRDAPPECSGCRFLAIDKDGDALCRHGRVSGKVFGDDGAYFAFCSDMRQPRGPCGPTGILFKPMDS